MPLLSDGIIKALGSLLLSDVTKKENLFFFTFVIFWFTLFQPYWIFISELFGERESVVTQISPSSMAVNQQLTRKGPRSDAKNKQRNYKKETKEPDFKNIQT